MLDLMAPLGRPPLDTVSPSLQVHTAEVMPPGIWEIELGAGWRATAAPNGFPNGAMPGASLRWGIVPGLELGTGVPGPASRMALVRYAVLPSLLAVDTGVDLPISGRSLAWELGSQLAIPSPWFIPRLSCRLSYQAGQGPYALAGNGWQSAASVGGDVPIGHSVTLGGELSLHPQDLGSSSIGFGIRSRLVANAGAALYAWAQPSGLPLGVGLAVATRF